MRRAPSSVTPPGLLQHGASREENAIVLQMLNSCVRPSEVARRIAVEHVNVSPMTVDMEEEEEATAEEGTCAR